jgi:hypothetical protein
MEALMKKRPGEQQKTGEQNSDNDERDFGHASLAVQL